MRASAICLLALVLLSSACTTPGKKRARADAARKRAAAAAPAPAAAAVTPAAPASPAKPAAIRLKPKGKATR